MRILHILLALLFLACTVLQFNDEGALPWIAAYGLVTLLFTAAAFGRYYRPLALMLTIILAVWALLLLPAFIDWLRMGAPTITGSMQAESPHVELVREFLGLLIAIAAMSFLVWRGTRAARS
ncbi:MAG: transmembrane 220 family protein [Flavobacteriales bacterium]|jgi:hypothetical protein|nr:transmembrane 220 family protein [Flavobacteriales bacterium]